MFWSWGMKWRTGKGRFDVEVYIIEQFQLCMIPKPFVSNLNMKVDDTIFFHEKEKVKSLIAFNLKTVNLIFAAF